MLRKRRSHEHRSSRHAGRDRPGPGRSRRSEVVRMVRWPRAGQDGQGVWIRWLPARHTLRIRRRRNRGGGRIAARPRPADAAGRCGDRRHHAQRCPVGPRQEWLLARQRRLRIHPGSRGGRGGAGLHRGRRLQPRPRHWLDHGRDVLGPVLRGPGARDRDGDRPLPAPQPGARPSDRSCRPLRGLRPRRGPMTNSLAPVVSQYFTTADDGDTEGLIGCFTSDAVVSDEGGSWQGHAEIRRWRDEVATVYDYTLEILGAGPVGEEGGLERQDVLTRLEGNFPGGTVDLTYRFGLLGGRIAELQITPS